MVARGEPAPTKERRRKPSGSSGQKRKPGVKLLGLILAAGWTAALVLVVAWNWTQVERNTHELALMALRISIEKDLTFRYWATGHGGVYVTATEETPPNPYLDHLPEHDLVTPSGRALTLMNPAYIMRQVHELGFERYGIYGRLTSLDPINPLNAADPWETEALSAFLRGDAADEISAVSELDGQRYIRLIKPFYTEEGCLTCHSHHDRRPGDLHGAISVAVPADPYAAMARTRQSSMVPEYLFIWLFGLAGIGWVMNLLMHSTRVVQESELRNRALLEAIPDILFRYSREGAYLDAELKEESLLPLRERNLLQSGRLVGQNIASVLPPEIAAKLQESIDQALATGKLQILEYSYTLDGKPYFFEERLVAAGREEVVSIVRDITGQKRFEEKLKQLSFHDQLTGLYNRTYFENELKRLGAGRDYPVTVASIDVDGLKLVNDTLGHARGDRLLKACAAVLQCSLRAADIVARVGGDEFVAILPRTDKKTGEEVVNRIRTQVELHNRRHGSPPLSLSIGVATAKKPGRLVVDTYKEADDLMYREKLHKGASVKERIIRALVASLEEKDYIAQGHAERLEDLCRRVGEKLKLSPDKLSNMALLAWVHDIGKADLPDEILLKNGSLTEEERKLIQQHPEKGYRIALSSPAHAAIADLILKHHERWDGTGYPLGLKGEEIPVECRILVIADAFDAMTNPRSYRKTKSRREAIAELQKNAGTQFDPHIVEIFLSVIEPPSPGARV